jgi:hypothetical protein
MSPDPLKAGPTPSYLILFPQFYSHIMQSRGHETQAQKTGSMSLITLPKVFPRTPSVAYCKSILLHFL